MASPQLDLVARLAREQQDIAAQALAQAQNQLATAQAQQAQMLSYLADYQSMARGEQRGSLPARALVEARQFLDQINAIVNTQRQQVVAAEEQVARQQLAWADAARYTRAIEKLAADRAALEAQASDKKLQQQLDDFYGQQQYFK